MKRLIPCFALLAVTVLVGCSGDSPSAPAVPTVVPSSWNISNLSVSDTNPFVGSPISVRAVVTQNGSPAPDNTTVRFLSSGPGTVFGFTGDQLTKGSLTLNEDVSVLTEDGVAETLFWVVYDPDDAFDNPGGDYTIQANVHDVSRQVGVRYNTSSIPDQPQIISVNPRRGSYDGFDTVEIIGRNIEAPVDVFFDLDGVPYQAVLTGMVDTCLDGSALPSCSAPEQLAQILTVQTPWFAGADTSIDQAADVRVVSGAGTGYEDTVVLADAYLLLSVEGPVIFGVAPNSGRSSGGETVNILGQNFGSDEDRLRVGFVDPDGFARAANVLGVSPDGTQIQVETPLFSTTPLDVDVIQDVQVETPERLVILDDSFLVLADQPQPEIASISPTAGPLDGGTLVTIFGSGFQSPMQVTFGDLEALDVNVFNDTSPSDNDRITCVSPDYSQEGEVPPVTVVIVVTNIDSGKTASLGGGFRYGNELYISGNSPSQGQFGDLVLIYGSGFEDPLQVFFPAGSNQRMQVVSVSGTELVVRIPETLDPSCTNSDGAFRVVLIETSLETEGGDFTLLGNSPQVLSVEPVTLQETGTIPSGVTPDEIVITGLYFNGDSQVQVGNFVVPSIDVDVPSDTTIEVDNLPGVDDLGVIFPRTNCITDGGLPGSRQAPAAVDVTVTNFPGSCADTLVGAFVIEPYDTTCEVASAITVSTLSFPPTQAPGPSPGQVLTISETSGATDVLISQIGLTARFFFDAGCSDQQAGPFIIPAGASDNSLTVYFCPNQDDGQVNNGLLSVVNDSPTSPVVQNLAGLEAFPIMGVAPLDVSAAALPVDINITNTGTGDLTWTAVVTGAGWVAAPVNGVILAGGAAQQVTVTTAGAGAGTVTITATEPDVQGSPATVTLTP